VFGVLFYYGDCCPYLEERDVRVPINEVAAHLLKREELSYGTNNDMPWDDFDVNRRFGSEQEAVEWENHEPKKNRWASNVELISCLYDLVRRSGIIRSVRAYVNRSGFHDSLRKLVNLKPQDLIDAFEKAGRPSDVRKAFNSAEHASAPVREAWKGMRLATSTVVGTEASRSHQNVELTAYRAMFGPHNVFCTPNLSDGTSPVLGFLLAEIREEGMPEVKLDVECPDLPKLDYELKRLGANNPVRLAMLFELMMQNFQEFVLGWPPNRGTRNTFFNGGGLMGYCKAFHAPVEEQYRGFDHGHWMIWLRHRDLRSLHRRIKTMRDLDNMRAAVRKWIEETAKMASALEMNSIGELAPLVGAGVRTRPDLEADNSN
jgi:hypothetical protein